MSGTLFSSCCGFVFPGFLEFISIVVVFGLFYFFLSSLEDELPVLLRI